VKRISIALILILSFSSSKSRAVEGPKPAPTAPEATEATDDTDDSMARYQSRERVTVKVGDIISYHYTEPGPGVTISGSMPQISGGYTQYMFRRSVPMFWGVDASYAGYWQQDMHYSGSIQNVSGNVMPLQAGATDRIATLRGKFGFALHDSPTHVLNFYFGMAIWNLHDKGTSAGSYDRSITYLYAPVGVEWAQRSGAFLWSSAFEFNPLLYGNVESDLSEANSSYPNVTNTQGPGDGIGFKLILNAEWRFGNWSLLVDAYDQYWKFGASDTQYVTIGTQTGSLIEPPNSTNMVGLDLGTRF
jgi:hypothetical protein